MGYVAAGYIATFGTIGMYAAWAVVQSRRAAATVLRRTDDMSTSAARADGAVGSPSAPDRPAP